MNLCTSDDLPDPAGPVISTKGEMSDNIEGSPAEDFAFLFVLDLL